MAELESTQERTPSIHPRPHKGVVALLLVAVILMGFLALYIGYAQYVGNPGGSVTTTPPVTVAEKAYYHNAEFGFSFEIPKEWKVTQQEYGIPSSPERYSYVQSPDFQEELVPGELEYYKLLSGAGVRVYTQKNPAAKNLADLKDFYKLGHDGPAYENVREVELSNGEKVLLYDIAEGRGGARGYLLSFVHENTWISISMQYKNMSDAVLFQKIISTFKFIEQAVDTSAWKTYRNEKYGFEFKYPGDWIFAEKESGFPYFYDFKKDVLEKIKLTVVTDSNGSGKYLEEKANTHDCMSGSEPMGCAVIPQKVSNILAGPLQGYLRQYTDGSQTFAYFADSGRNITVTLQSEKPYDAETFKKIYLSFKFIQPSVPLLKVNIEGGLCAYGMCSSQITIQPNGTYVYVIGSNKKSQGTLTPQLMQTLQQLISQTDFNHIKSQKFTGTCPTAYDGQEFIYTFYAPKETLSSCAVVIDSKEPLFNFISGLLQLVYSGESE